MRIRAVFLFPRTIPKGEPPGEMFLATVGPYAALVALTA
ncbi:MAG: hypothetical protein ACJA2W_002841 [Planctomycetota bacterium]|jgi:hypothetical protein